jgi:hypothetical protein
VPRAAALVLPVLLAGLAAAAAEPPDPAAADPRELARLIGQLGSPAFAVREKAGRRLEALGPAALGALREAARTGDAEARRRAAALAERIGRLLAPTLVALHYDKTPLADAVADLARRSGAPITLHGDPAKFKGRTVTIVTDPWPFWQALPLFCQWAGLHEWDGYSPLPPALPGTSAAETGGVQVLGQMAVRRGRLSAYTWTAPPARVALLDGPGPAGPAHHAGAVRVRCLPPGTPFPAEAGKEDFLLPLQIAAEPRLNAHDAVDLRVERALDDRGRPLPATTVKVEIARDEDEWQGRGFNGRFIPPPPATRSGPVAVRLPRGDRPAKRLRELAGVITIQTFAAAPAVTLAKPADAVGRPGQGEDGLTLKLIALTRLNDHEIQVTADEHLPFGVQLPHAVSGSVGIGAWGGRGFGGIITDEPETAPAGGTDYQGLSLEDDHGRRFAVVSGGSDITGLTPQAFTLRVTATFRLPAGGAGPAKLVLAVRRPALIEVPFVLKDVPLP